MNELGAKKEKVKTLIYDFSCLSEEEKINFLLSCIRKCKLTQIQTLYKEAERILATDFVDILPLELTEKIFSYLDASSLCRAALVNSKWRAASNNNALWYHICEKKQLTALCYSKALQRNPEVLVQLTSAGRKTVITSHKPYDFCMEASTAAPLKRVCKWKDHYVRVSHLERNWVNGLYIVKPVLRGHTQPVTCMDCSGKMI